jgi:hypothetical protein
VRRLSLATATATHAREERRHDAVRERGLGAEQRRRAAEQGERDADVLRVAEPGVEGEAVAPEGRHHII